MLKISAEVNQQDIKNLLENFSGNFVRKAIRSALDKTGTWSKNYIGDELGEKYKLPARDVRRAMHLLRTTQTKLSCEIVTEGTALELIKHFNAIQDSAGVTAIIAPGWVKRTPHAFINKPKNSRKNVVMLRTGRRRYPTTGKPGYGPPIPALLGRTAIMKIVKIKLSDHLYKELAEQIAKRASRPQLPAEFE